MQLMLIKGKAIGKLTIVLLLDLSKAKEFFQLHKECP